MNTVAAFPIKYLSLPVQIVSMKNLFRLHFIFSFYALPGIHSRLH